MLKKIKKHEEIHDAYVLVNEEYKVFMIYGAKIILLDTILLQQMKQYIELYRPLVSEDSKLYGMERYVFTSSRFTTTKPLGQKMDHSAISNGMTSSFHKANVFKDTNTRVSCSRIRMSVLTEIVTLGSENISTIASYFGKHSEKVCKKHVQHYSEHEAARLSWKCYKMYKTKEDMKKAAEVPNKAIQKARITCARKIQKWMEEIIRKIQLLTNFTIEDTNVMKELEKLALHEDNEGLFYIHTIFI